MSRENETKERTLDETIKIVDRFIRETNSFTFVENAWEQIKEQLLKAPERSHNSRYTKCNVTIANGICAKSEVVCTVDKCIF